MLAVYVIKEGKAQSVASGSSEQSDPLHMTTGSCFGEEAFKGDGENYTATVTATETLTCLVINCETFKSSDTVKIAAVVRDQLAIGMAHRRMSQRQQMPRKQDLEVLTLIGVGSFGRVRLVRHAVNNSFFALKCMNKGLVIARKQVSE